MDCPALAGAALRTVALLTTRVVLLQHHFPSFILSYKRFGSAPYDTFFRLTLNRHAHHASPFGYSNVWACPNLKTR
jgi:hypothetical protein